VTSLLTIFVLSLTRSQLSAFELNNQIVSAQQNGRAGADYVEPLLRNACAGISSGVLEVNLPARGGAAATDVVTSCLRVWNGATIPAGTFNVTATGGTFSHGTPASAADAVEIVYGTARGYTRVVSPSTSLSSTSPTITVFDIGGN